jgi:hypothetical protein
MQNFIFPIFRQKTKQNEFWKRLKLEYQIILRWINKTVLKEKIPSSSKIISLLSGGSLVKITPESLKSADKKSETDNKFLELIGKSFGKDFNLVGFNSDSCLVLSDNLSDMALLILSEG